MGVSTVSSKNALENLNTEIPHWDFDKVKLEAENKWKNYFLIVLWVEWILLCISILTTKQHYMFDLFSGLAVGIIAWEIYKPVLKMISEKGIENIIEELEWD